MIRRIPVVPVLVAGASFPTPEELPEELADLKRRNAVQVTDENFLSDVDRLAERMTAAVNGAAPVMPNRDAGEEEERVEERPSGDFGTSRSTVQSVKSRPALLAVAAIALSNVAAILTSLDKISQILYGHLGTRALGALSVGGILILVTGYLLVLFWVRREVLSRWSGSRHWLAVSLTATLLAGLLAANWHFLPKHPQSDLLFTGSVPRWRSRVLARQAEEGGIRFSAHDPSSPPQVWTTAQCLKGLLASAPGFEEYRSSVRSAFEFIEGERQEDGWGYWFTSNYSVTEITAWVVLAYIESLKRPGIWDAEETSEIVDRIVRDLDAIVARQDPSGGFSPIAEVSPELTRTYSSVMAIWALVDLNQVAALREGLATRYSANLSSGVVWLLHHFKPNKGWTPNPVRGGEVKPWPGLSAQVLFTLSDPGALPWVRDEPRYREALAFLLGSEELRKRSPAMNNIVPDFDTHLMPTGIQMEQTTFLWYPWALAHLLQFPAVFGPPDLKDPLLARVSGEGVRCLVQNLVPRCSF